MNNTTLMNYYKKITDMALKNLALEKSFQFKAKLKSNVMSIQAEDHLQNVFKLASGTQITDEC